MQTHSHIKKNLLFFVLSLTNSFTIAKAMVPACQTYYWTPDHYTDFNGGGIAMVRGLALDIDATDNTVQATTDVMDTIKKQMITATYQCLNSDDEDEQEIINKQSHRNIASTIGQYARLNKGNVSEYINARSVYKGVRFGFIIKKTPCVPEKMAMSDDDKEAIADFLLACTKILETSCTSGRLSVKVRHNTIIEASIPTVSIDFHQQTLPNAQDCEQKALLERKLAALLTNPNQSDTFYITITIDRQHIHDYKANLAFIDALTEESTTPQLVTKQAFIQALCQKCVDEKNYEQIQTILAHAMEHRDTETLTALHSFQEFFDITR